MDEKTLKKMSREDLIAQSRATESQLNVLRSQAGKNAEADKQTLGEAEKTAKQIGDRLKEMDEEGSAPLDKEGTAPTLADGEGNYAPDAETANVGGIGVKDSNTNPDRVKKEQAKALEGNTEDRSDDKAKEPAAEDRSKAGNKK